MAQQLGSCGPYQLLRFVDAGGMGEIFLARGPTPSGHRSLVAIKRLLPQIARDRAAVGMFMDEAHLTTRLDHPNVGHVHKLGRDGSHYFLVMEWIDGVSLRILTRRIAQTGPIPWFIAARIITDVAAGLHYAHELSDANGKPFQLVHRDVSPSNIMVGFDGRTRLLDFGLAKTRAQLEKTKPGTVKGKFAYLAPEQLRGQVTPLVDVFALGLCLWETLMGRQLFDLDTIASAAAAIHGFEGAPPVRPHRPEVPERLDWILSRALDPNPRLRFQSAAEVRDELLAVLADEGKNVTDSVVADWLTRVYPERIPLPVDDHPSRADPTEVMETVADLVDEDAPGGGALGKIALFAAALAIAALATAVYLGLVELPLPAGTW